MEDLVSKGEKVLRWVSLCKKHETSTEKVFPFPKLEQNKQHSEIKMEVDNVSKGAIFYKQIIRFIESGCYL